MSDKQLKILVGVLVALVAAWGIGRLASGGGGRSGPAPYDLGVGVEMNIDSVIVTTADSTVSLRHGDGWTVNGHEAVAEAGESLKRALEEAEVGQLVSRNPENHERLGVTEEKGRHLVVYSGGSEQLSLIFGKRGHGFDQAYVRRAGADEVYMLSGTLVSLANRGVDDWRNKEILQADRETVQGIEYDYADESFRLVRDSANWRLEPSGAGVEATAVSGLLSQLSNLRAIGFAADSVVDTLTWEPPTARVRVRGPGDALLGELLFLKRADGVGYYARRAGSPVVYTLSTYSGDQILKHERDLAPSHEGQAEVEGGGSS